MRAEAVIRYYLIKVDYEYMENSYGDYTTLKTRAGRLRLQDKEAMQVALEDWGITAYEFVPTSYKQSSNTFIWPHSWEQYRRFRKLARPWRPK